jgi:hypothetical protein
MSTILTNKISGDNIFYDLEIQAENINKLAVFNINRTDIILDNPSDYYLGILDFSLPLFAIPLFSFIDGRYKFFLEFDGLRLENTLLWVPESANTSPVFQSVYSYLGFITSMNNSLKKLYDDMKLAKPFTFLATEQIFVTLENDLISINYEDYYYLNNSFLCCNKPLYEFLTSFQVFFESSLLIRFLYNNHMRSYIRAGKTYYKLTQQNMDLDNWSSLESILFQTSTVPVAGEIIGAQNNEQILVLGDYIHLPNENRSAYYNFVSKAPIRLSNLNSNFPLSQMDVTIRWFNKEGASEIIIITQQQNARIKLVFVRKTVEDINNIDLSGYGIR